ncbi:MAG: hypothetical protein IPM03_19605 [Sulfuritalea sp.]|nr:hypothetical protein [Sulfuritalea sp.]
MNWPKYIWDFWNDLGPLANIIQIVASGLGGAVFIYRILTRRIRSQTAIQENLEEALSLGKREILDLQRELTDAKQYDPHIWLEIAAKERKERNEEKAVAALQLAFKQNG